MESFEDLDELSISLDITARLALVSIGKILSGDEADRLFFVLSEQLSSVYDPEKVKKLIDMYKKSVAELRVALGES